MTRMKTKLVACTWLQEEFVKVPKTHFEQVPLETIKELVEPEIVENKKTDKAVEDEAQIPKKEKR